MTTVEPRAPAPLTPVDGTYDAYMRGFKDGREEGLSLAERAPHSAQESTDAAIDYNDALGRIATLEAAATFLLERLDDFERDDSWADEVEAYRQFAGHVHPAMARLRAALSQQQEGQ